MLSSSYYYNQSSSLRTLSYYKSSKITINKYFPRNDNQSINRLKFTTLKTVEIFGRFFALLCRINIAFFKLMTKQGKRDKTTTSQWLLDKKNGVDIIHQMICIGSMIRSLISNVSSFSNSFEEVQIKIKWNGKSVKLCGC